MLTDNLEALKKHNAELAEQIEKTTLSGKTTLFLNSNREVNLAYENIALHDIENPLQESKKVFEQQVPPENRKDNGIVFIFGFGLGYLFKRTFVETTGQIIVFEPYLEVLRHTFEVIDFSQELSSPRVHIITNTSQLIHAISSRYIIGDEFKTIALPTYQEKEPELFLEVLKEMKSIITHTATGQSTAAWSVESFIQSALGNMKHILKYPDPSFLNGELKGMPGVIVSAGPSLDRPDVIESLKAHRDNLVVAAVGTACRALEHANIVPDFVMMLESKNISGQLKGVTFLDKTNLVLLPQAHESLFEFQAKKTFVSYVDTDPLKDWVGKALNREIFPYYNQGTVSVMALVHLIHMGCNPIFLIGQDLAFPEGKLYSSNAVYKNYRLVEDADGNKSCEMDNIDEMYGIFLEGKEQWEQQRREMTKGFVQTEGWNGEKLYTRMTYLSFKKSLEYLQNIFPQTKLVNCSEGGAKIEGMEHLPFVQAFEKYQVKKFHPHPILNKLIEDRYVLFEEGSEPYHKVYNQYQNDRTDLKFMIDKTKDATALVTKIEKALKNRPFIDLAIKKQLAQLDAIDKDILRLSAENSLINCYIGKEMLEFAQTYERKNTLAEEKLLPGDIKALKENLESSTFLYKAVEKGSEKLMETLDPIFEDFPLNPIKTASGGSMVLESVPLSPSVIR